MESWNNPKLVAVSNIANRRLRQYEPFTAELSLLSGLQGSVICVIEQREENKNVWHRTKVRVE